MFGNLPLHPAVVHLPIGIVFLLPLLTIFMAALVYRWSARRQTFLVLIFLHLALVGSSYAALETGEDEEHKVEKIVAESAIESHEERAEVFMIGTVVVLILSFGLLLPTTGVLLKLALSLLLIGQLALLALGYRVGHSGGELVYIHGAAEAYMNDQITTDKAPPKSKALRE